MLPAEFYGAWKFEGSSGGFSGRGDDGYKIDRIVITRSNVIESYKGNSLVYSVPFTVGKGRSIYSGKEELFIKLEMSDMPQVVSLHERDTLTFSDNVYDGFSYSYKRIDKTEKGKQNE